MNGFRLLIQAVSLVVVAGALSVGCASSRSGSDAGTPIGAPCDSNEDCSSGLCIFIEGGGLCTELCGTGECPQGWECYGVSDVAEPGEVSSVCVPVDLQLCRSCENNTDCSLAGDDMCLAGPNGSTFCGRDCSVVGCPVGYECSDVEVDDVSSKQCVPVTGACDCGPAEIDSTEDCTITTAFGDCSGTRTCLGPTGWSDCLPPNEIDLPDDQFVDDNCDGIDGDADASILVGPTGSDDVGCGLAFNAPCRSIGFGIEQAEASNRTAVLIQQGFYAEVVEMSEGISLYGGYDDNWQRGLFTADAHRVEIIGGAHPDTNFFTTIRAIGIDADTVVADLNITGPGAVGQNNDSGRSSYAVHITSSTGMRFERVVITAGNGAAGQSGTNGANAPTVGRVSAMNGRTGGASNEFSSACNTTSHGLGAARGTNSCSGGLVTPNGGNGGNGGEMDTSCNFLGICSNCTATPGDPGSNASHVFGTRGRGGSGGTGGGLCGPAGIGQPGRILNGTRGTGGPAGGFLLSGVWHSRAGGSGALGDNGGGGGGGGGSGGCDDGTDSYGAGGGGGGAGGCRATSTASGGFGGGGSFGFFVINSTSSMTDCTIIRGNGGAGGAGGIGGRGQSGGLSGSGGSSTNDSAPGGNGGAGGHGGHGGGGGGGTGGPSVGVAHFNSTVTNECATSGGAGGAAGPGGASAPTAPVAERDGNNGTAGQPGQVSAELAL